MNKEPIQTQVILVTGSKMMQYWGDKLFARLLNWKMLNGCGKHMSHYEFNSIGKRRKAIVIAFGSVDVNDVARKICSIYPDPIYSGTTFWGGYYYMHCGAIKDNEKYEIIDPCILLAGKTLLGTFRAVWSVVFGEWNTLCKELIATNWDSIASTEKSKWRTKFWNQNENDIVAEESNRNPIPSQKVNQSNRSESKSSKTIIGKGDNAFDREFIKNVQFGKMLRGEISEVEKLRIEVALYLKEEYPKEVIHSNNLYTLPANIKKKGREYLRLKLDNSLHFKSKMTEVFRKPKKSKAAQDDNVYKDNQNTKFED